MQKKIDAGVVNQLRQDAVNTLKGLVNEYKAAERLYNETIHDTDGMTISIGKTLTLAGRELRDAEQCAEDAKENLVEHLLSHLDNITFWPKMYYPPENELPNKPAPFKHGDTVKFGPTMYVVDCTWSQARPGWDVILTPTTGGRSFIWPENGLVKIYPFHGPDAEQDEVAQLEAQAI